MKNPKINRIIGYIVMFAGFFVFYKGFHSGSDGSTASIPLIAVSLVLVIGAVVWMILKVRCPHCGKQLPIKLYRIDTCPYCGEKTTEEK